jgi:IclR family pca regulon transcriptional regulator
VTEPTSSSVRRLTEVLSALSTADAAASDGLVAQELGERVARDPASLDPTVEALAAAGLVERHGESGRLRTGWGLYVLGARIVAARARAVAPSYVADLVQRTGESAYALRLHGMSSVAEAEQSGPSDLHVASWIGRPFPVYGSDGGPALLLDLSREEIAARFGDVEFEAFGPNTPRSPAELWERIEQARARGWALLDEEGEPGIVSAAAPVRSFTGEIVLALAVVGPRFRLLPRIEEAGAAVVAAAGELSAELGYRSPYAAESASAAARTRAPTASTLRASRADGAGTSSAPTIVPSASRTGAATPASPVAGPSSTRT